MFPSPWKRMTTRTFKTEESSALGAGYQHNGSRLSSSLATELLAGVGPLQRVGGLRFRRPSPNDTGCANYQDTPSSSVLGLSLHSLGLRCNGHGIQCSWRLFSLSPSLPFSLSLSFIPVLPRCRCVRCFVPDASPLLRVELPLEKSALSTRRGVHSFLLHHGKLQRRPLRGFAI